MVSAMLQGRAGLRGKNSKETSREEARRGKKGPGKAGQGGCCGNLGLPRAQLEVSAAAAAAAAQPQLVLRSRVLPLPRPSLCVLPEWFAVAGRPDARFPFQVPLQKGTQREQSCSLTHRVAGRTQRVPEGLQNA